MDNGAMKNPALAKPRLERGTRFDGGNGSMSEVESDPLTPDL